MLVVFQDEKHNLVIADNGSGRLSELGDLESVVERLWSLSGDLFVELPLFLNCSLSHTHTPSLSLSHELKLFFEDIYR